MPWTNSAGRGCMQGDQMVRALLEAGATDDVNVRFGAKRESALHVAATRGAEDSCSALMIAGADPNVRDSGESSPLHLAVAAGHHRVVRVLLLKGAHVDTRTWFGEAPLQLAASAGHTLYVSELLLGGADKDVVSGFLGGGTTPLFKAAALNHLGVVKKLLTAGADRCRPNLDGNGPFDIAATRGHATILKAFLETGTKVVAADATGWTALHSAASGEHSLDNGAAVRLLLEAGADVNAKATSGKWYTPLHVAVDRRVASIGTIYALMEGGANVNVGAQGGQKPLHVACRRSRVATVELLLRWGADEKLTNEDGDTPADVMGAAGHAGNMTDKEADNHRIRRMLARAPADRSWRRRGWLVLNRYRPTRVEIDISYSSISKGCSSKVARVSGEDSSRDDEETEDQMTIDWRGLVGRLVGLEADSVFRLVIGFL